MLGSSLHTFEAATANMQHMHFLLQARSQTARYGSTVSINPKQKHICQPSGASQTSHDPVTNLCG